MLFNIHRNSPNRGIKRSNWWALSCVCIVKNLWHCFSSALAATEVRVEHDVISHKFTLTIVFLVLLLCLNNKESNGEHYSGIGQGWEISYTMRSTSQSIDTSLQHHVLILSLLHEKWCPCQISEFWLYAYTFCTTSKFYTLHHACLSVLRNICSSFIKMNSNVFRSFHFGIKMGDIDLRFGIVRI